MDKVNSSKVAVDSKLAQEVPTVYVSTVPEADSHITEQKKGRSEQQEMPSSSPTPVSIIRRFINFFFDFLETTVVALSIFVVAYLFLVQPHEIKGNSMEPNFHNNEYILTDKISYKFSEPKRGDVIIFKAPKNPEIDYIKRIIGLPGDHIKVQNGQVYLNGKPLKEVYLKDPTSLFPGSYLQEGVEIVVPQEEYFAMGDNRPHSSDSREFGPVPVNLIIGKAILRYWPLSQIGTLPKVSY